MPPDPLVLAFDTSAAHCAAALLSGNRILAARLEEMSKGQAERLMPLLEEVLAEANVVWSDLTAIGVGIGPGNFTGIRISVAAARGLALGLGVPAVGVSVLEAQAYGKTPPYISVTDARRGAFYAQNVTAEGTDAPVFVAPEAATSMADGDVPLVGAIPGATPPALPLAEAIARIAVTRAGDECPRPAPLYVRPVDAKPPSDPPPKLLP